MNPFESVEVSGGEKKIIFDALSARIAAIEALGKKAEKTGAAKIQKSALESKADLEALRTKFL